MYIVSIGNEAHKTLSYCYSSNIYLQINYLITTILEIRSFSHLNVNPNLGITHLNSKEANYGIDFRMI